MAWIGSTGIVTMSVFGRAIAPWEITRAPGLDLALGVGLGARLAGDLRLGLPLLGPRDRETGVEDAARIQRGGGRVDDGQRRDRRERRRSQRCGEQLADAAVRDPQHADLV